VRGFVVNQWYALLSSTGTPRAIIERLNRDTNKALTYPDVIARFTADGAEAAGGTPQMLAAHIKGEREKWAKVIKDAGIRGD